jgi:hypothetical protein
MTNININSQWERSGNKVEEVFLKVLANRVHSTRLLDKGLKTNSFDRTNGIRHHRYRGYLKPPRVSANNSYINSLHFSKVLGFYSTTCPYKRYALAIHVDFTSCTITAVNCYKWFLFFFPCVSIYYHTRTYIHIFTCIHLYIYSMYALLLPTSRRK